MKAQNCKTNSVSVQDLKYVIHSDWGANHLVVTIDTPELASLDTGTI